ncbi:antirestriction protein ArdA [Enterococcus faecalis]|nr:antirestriction protein ArdA [Enterococcus faecalis]
MKIKICVVSNRYINRRITKWFELPVSESRFYSDLGLSDDDCRGYKIIDYEAPIKISENEHIRRLNDFALFGNERNEYRITDFNKREGQSEIYIRIRQNFKDGSFVNHNGMFLVRSDSVGSFVDFGRTRFKELGKIYLENLTTDIRVDF